jgi:hypothetical protein
VAAEPPEEMLENVEKRKNMKRRALPNSFLIKKVTGNYFEIR